MGLRNRLKNRILNLSDCKTILSSVLDQNNSSQLTWDFTGLCGRPLVLNPFRFKLPNQLAWAGKTLWQLPFLEEDVSLVCDLLNKPQMPFSALPATKLQGSVLAK